MTAPDLYLLASEAPGVLDDWTGPVEYHRGKNGRGDEVWEPGAVVNGWVCYAPAPPIRLPLARAEVRE